MWRIMKLIIVIMTAFLMQVSASTFGQQLTITKNNISLREVFRQIRKQTGYTVLATSDLVNSAKPSNLNLNSAPLEDALKIILADKNLDYAIKDKAIFIREKVRPSVLDKIISPFVDITVSGVVMDENGEKLVGATVKVVGGKQTSTDQTGSFVLTGIDEKAVIEISYIGYNLVTVSAKDNLSAIKMTRSNSKLDEIQIIAYGTTTKRLNTGSVTTISASDIAKQPISNPLAALAGQVPGLTVVQSNGNAGSAINLQIRGINSISQGSMPLFLVDGVPFPNAYIGIGGFVMGNGGQSPFANINPSDIESISILKDADATAIYGSRGANGVVLITTKKGKNGKMKFDANVYQGAGEVTRKIDLMNTQQYVTMRKEAFKNDNITPSASNAPDLILWDTTRYTDWQKELIGGTANFTNANISLSGGSEQTQYLLSGNYTRQTSVYPGSFADQRGTGRFSINHMSLDKRFTLSATGSYAVDKNELPLDLTTYITLSPNAPALYDKNGRLNWSENGGAFANPLQFLLANSSVTTDNFISNINMKYRIFDGFSAKVTAGYSLIKLDQKYRNPKSAQDPNSNPIATATFGDVTSKNWILEPQLEYIRKIGKGLLSILTGATMQNDIRDSKSIIANGFSNDGLINAAAFATSITANTSLTEYRYQALFGRLNYDWDNKYLLNITARRDGSSRFGPGKQASNFGAIGAAWIFSEEQFLKSSLPFLTYGKLRGSYGVTGNDQIGDYQFRDDYRATARQYAGQIGYVPSRLFNADYAWERNKKLEAAIELGFFNKVNISVNYFRNRSDNQLLAYRLPDQTGFGSIFRNFGAVVENSGFELEIQSSNLSRKNFTWSTSGNLTIPKNELLAFPGLESSSYASTLVIGEPLNIQKLFEFQGVDPVTGLYKFNGTVIPTSQTSIGNLSPKFYGGISNTFKVRNFDFSFLFQFVKQNGINYTSAFVANAPGTQFNQPIEVLGRWTKAGDIADFQKFTTTGVGYNNYAVYSTARISDASFIRLKNVSISYSVPRSLLDKAKINGVRIYLQGNNLLTFTRYRGLDPESGSNTLPVLRVLTAGLQLTL